MTVDGVHEPNNEIANEEHDHDALARKVTLYGWDSAVGVNRKVFVDSTGKLQVSI